MTRIQGQIRRPSFIQDSRVNCRIYGGFVYRDWHQDDMTYTCIIGSNDWDEDGAVGCTHDFHEIHHP